MIHETAERTGPSGLKTFAVNGHFQQHCAVFLIDVVASSLAHVDNTNHETAERTGLSNLKD